MKIKTKKQLNLPQLLEWAWDNPDLSNGMTFISNGCERVQIDFRYNPRGVLNLDVLNGSNISNDIQFTLEECEEITEDTVIPKLLTTFETINVKNKVRYQRVRIDENYTIKLMLNITEVHREPVETLHIVNDDGTHTLIWRDGRLIE